MRSTKLSAALLAVMLLCSQLFAANTEKTPVNINFKNLEIVDFVKLTSKIIDKNILLTDNIRGKVDFVSTKTVYESDLLNIVQSVLASKGYTLVDRDAFLEIVRINEAAQYNLPVVQTDTGPKMGQMITRALQIQKEDVNSIASKIRHLVSKYAKLVTVNETNTLLVTDFPKNIETIKEVIDLLQQSSAKDVMFIELDNVKVKEIFSNIQQVTKELFNPKASTQKIDLIANNSANSIVAVGTAKQLQKIKAIINDFDKEDESVKQDVKILSLKNSESKTMIKVVQDIIKNKTYATKEITPSVSVNEDTNSIIVVGPGESVAEIEAIVRELDKEKQQVYVQAKIVEISEERSKEVGFKYGLQGGMANSGGLFAGSVDMGGPSALGAIDASLLDYIDTGVIKEGLALGANLKLLNDEGAADVLSEPSILCIDNKESSIYVGETRSIQTSSVSGDTSDSLTRNQYTREDIGLTLTVKPRISNDGKVTLDVTTLLEDVKASSTSADRPDTTKREVKTVALVQNGESIILGGLIKNKNDQTRFKIPLLGDIPGLGYLFRYNQDAVSKTNLVVILTPYVVPTSSDLTALRDKLNRLNKIESDYYDRYKKALNKKQEVKNTPDTSQTDPHDPHGILKGNY